MENKNLIVRYGFNEEKSLDRLLNEVGVTVNETLLNIQKKAAQDLLSNSKTESLCMKQSDIDIMVAISQKAIRNLSNVSLEDLELLFSS